ncbi:MAG: iron ABC transporter permease [Burkholderiaceae bacterium]
MSGAPARARRLLLGLVLLAVLLAVLGCLVGSTGFEAWSGWRDDPVALRIVRDIRLPRSLGAWLAGALLGLAGAIAQGVFRNPLADPYLLGSASGASLFVALSMALGGVAPGTGAWLARVGLSGAAFAGAMLALVLTLTLARGLVHTMRLLLAGVIVGVVLGALSTMTVIWFPEIMAAQQSFLVGGTVFIGWSAVVLMAVVLAACLPLAWLCSPLLDALALGEATARSLGLPLVAGRGCLIVLLALATGSAVAQAGLIAFVGLAAPHLVRSIARTSHRWLMPLSALTGGTLLAGADLVARAAIAPRELPVGVLTAVFGGGYLLWLMHRRAHDEEAA